MLVSIGTSESAHELQQDFTSFLFVNEVEVVGESVDGLLAQPGPPKRQKLESDLF